ncbi:hypothetical protein KOW79_000308 [Hemibagrus wyckioides]|uniref:G-protein coupled receptors family 1 profile domain-containing protein n=1 Tax=Hemibagrus wyckioides TaxID=337641 RepID=A0A9D3SUN1_9TELE|nr:hypothetical protein KOW79_000308 [Hemibagrus wyckioides]
MSDVCLFNLALSDLLFLLSLPFWAHYAAITQWVFGNFMCHAVTALYMLGYYGSIFFMMLMTIDRYAVIVHTYTSLFQVPVMVFATRIIPILMIMKSQKNHKAVRLMLVLVSVFFIFWTPYNIAIFLKFLHQLGYINTGQW